MRTDAFNVVVVGIIIILFVYRNNDDDSEKCIIIHITQCVCYKVSRIVGIGEGGVGGGMQRSY